MNKMLIILLIFIQLFTSTTKTHAAERQDENNLNQAVTVSTEAAEKAIAAALDTKDHTFASIEVGTARADEYVISGTASQIALKKAAEKLVTEKFGKGQFKAFEALIERESGWNPYAVNRSSGACGLGQALPCSKMADKSPTGQLNWTVAYIAQRYGTPAHAWSIWRTQGWY